MLFPEGLNELLIFELCIYVLCFLLLLYFFIVRVFILDNHLFILPGSPNLVLDLLLLF